MACGTKMIPTIIPDITSPQTYSLMLYLGNQRITGKNPDRVDRILGTEQVTACFSFDLRTDTAGFRWRTCRSKRMGMAGGVSAVLAASSMVSERKKREHSVRKREALTMKWSALLLRKRGTNTVLYPVIPT